MPSLSGPARWTRWARYASAALVVLALSVPPRGLAAALTDAASSGLPDVILGVWLLKAALLINAALLWVAGSYSLAGPGGEPNRSPVDPDRGDPVSIKALLLLLILLALAIRLTALGEGLWFDEIVTLMKYVQVPFGTTISTFDTQNQHLFYSLSAKASTAMFGYGAWALRLPAVLYGVASVAALYWFARPVVGVRESFAASALLTFSYHHVWFSQNARGYTALLLFTLLGTGLYVRIVRRGWTGWGAAAAYGGVMAIGVYTHLSALAVVAAHGLVWVWLLWRRRETESAAIRTVGAGILLTATLSFLLYALVLPQVVRTLLAPTAPQGTVEWTRPSWLALEAIAGLSRGLPGGVATLVAGGALFVVGVYSLFRRTPLLAWLLLLPAVIALALIVGFSHNLWPRFFFFSAGFGALILMRGIHASARALNRKWGTAIGAAASVALVLASASTVPAAWGPKQDFAGAAEYVEGASAPGDAVVTVDLTTLPYVAYLEKPWGSVQGVGDLSEVEAGHAQTWLLYIFPARLRAAQPEIWMRLEREYTRAAEFTGTLRGGGVVVMRREGTQE